MPQPSPVTSGHYPVSSKSSLTHCKTFSYSLLNMRAFLSLGKIKVPWWLSSRNTWQLFCHKRICNAFEAFFKGAFRISSTCIFAQSFRCRFQQVVIFTRLLLGCQSIGKHSDHSIDNFRIPNRITDAPVLRHRIGLRTRH